MIEVRTFDGEARDLARFSFESWSKAGFAHRRPIPRWDESYFQYQLLGDPSADPEYRVAAYDGSRLVGMLLCHGTDFRLWGDVVHGTSASWLTVDPDYRGQGVASKVAAEARRRHQERQAVFCFGYGLLGTDGPGFWGSQPDTVVTGRYGFWVRVLEPEDVRRWSYSGLERAGTYLSQAFQRTPRAAGSSRPYEPRDLESILALHGSRIEGLDLACMWSRERLAYQLGDRSFFTTHVLEGPGGVEGAASFFTLDFVARDTLRTAIIDLLVTTPGLPLHRGRLLLRDVLSAARARGAGAALILRQATHPPSLLLSAGFVPMPVDFEGLYAFAIPGLNLEDVKSYHLYYR